MGYPIMAKDGMIGKVDGFFFDDREWTVRYLVADTGRWLPGRLVLISPAALCEPNAVTHAFPVNLTREQVRGSPPIQTDQPVSPKQEMEMIRFYGWPVYPAVSQSFGEPIEPPPMQPPAPESAEHPKPQGDPHLRSLREILGYRIHATDGEIGHVKDLIVDDENWRIHDMVVDTRNWWPGKSVIVPPLWVESIEYHAQHGEIRVNVAREAIRASQEFDPSAPVNMKHEDRAYDYLGRPKF